MTLRKRIITLALLVVMCISMGGALFSAFSIRTGAAEVHSSALSDLTNAENFSIEKFPTLTLEYLNQINADTDKTNDQPLLEVIQIAESTTDELILYVYNPTFSELELTATAVLISTEFSPDGQNITPDIYDIDLVSQDSVFQKYVVKDFQVSEEPYRYYNIVTLYRDYHPDIDEVTAGGVVENYEIGIRVGQQWCAYYLNDSIVYEVNTFFTAEIDIGYTGSLEFSSGLTLGNFSGKFDFGDVWFIAFDVEDYVVRKIYDADLTYKIRDKRSVGNNVEYGEWSEDLKATLKEGDTMSYEGEGIFAKEFTWNTICSSSDFISQLEDQNVNISEDARKHLGENAWVFAFMQTEKQATVLPNGVYIVSSQISAVTVIRLHFMDIKGDVYNLGVVSDRVSPDDVPDGFGGGTNIPEWAEKLLMIVSLILIIVVVIFLMPFIKSFFKIVFTGVKFIFSILWNIISLPVKILKFLLK